MCQFLKIILNKIIWLYCLQNGKILKFYPSCPNLRRREKINLNFYFHTSLWYLKREVPQRSVKDKHLT